MANFSITYLIIAYCEICKSPVISFFVCILCTLEFSFRFLLRDIKDTRDIRDFRDETNN
jgi:hypothetical protein